MAAFFTEFFRIESSELDFLYDPELERSNENSLWLQRIGDLELVGLWEVLPNADSDGTLMGDLLSDPESGVLIMGVPDNFITSLVEVDEEQLLGITEEWSKLEELRDWSLEDLLNVVRKLKSFFQEAKNHEQIIVQLAEL